MKCAVGKCEQSNNKKSTVSFYKFPRDAAQRKLWIMFCNRWKPVNAQKEKICSLHFKHEDYERNFKFEMGFSNLRTPKLKPGAVPTIETSSGIIKCDFDYDFNSNGVQDAIENAMPIAIPSKSLTSFQDTLLTNTDVSPPVTKHCYPQEGDQSSYTLLSGIKTREIGGKILTSFRNRRLINTYLSPPVAKHCHPQEGDQSSNSLHSEIKTIAEAQKIVKVLEQYATLKHNFRATSLLIQLEYIFMPEKV